MSRNPKNAATNNTIRKATGSEVEFLSLILHELKHPLTPIRHSLALLKTLCAESQQQHALGTLDHQVEYLSHLMDDVMESARIRCGLVTLKKQWVDIARLAEQAIDAVKPKIEASKQHLYARLPEKPVLLFCDEARLRQILNHLLDNAIASTQPGGEVQIAITTTENHLILEVGDNGTGIPKARLHSAFNLLSPAMDGADASITGFGIGLAIARSLVELHGGSIQACSEGIGRGSTFTVTLPMVSTLEVKNALPTGRPKQSKRILIVDDNVDATDSLSELLKLRGYTVEKAYDGITALQIAARFQPSIVLLDIGLPGINGLDVAKRLRAESTFVKPLLIAVTAYGAESDYRRSREAGFDHHLVKPFGLKALSQLLDPQSPPSDAI